MRARRGGIGRRLGLGWRLVVLGLCVGGPAAWAHEGPEHEIEELTAVIEARGESADLLLERAVEYLVLGRNREAARDLARAVELNPGSIHARRELARVQFLQGEAEAAVTTVTRALKLEAGEAVDRAGLWMLRAEIYRSQKQWRRALADCDAAIERHPANPEWYLMRSDLQRRLRQDRKRVEGLEEGLRQTGAGILRIERIDALLDAKRYRQASTAIEPELASARLRGRWLVRRGRARLGMGDTQGGEEDLRAALAEIDGRLDAHRPDTMLLWDRATAQMLLGDRVGARRTYEWARERGGDTELTERLGELVSGGERR